MIYDSVVLVIYYFAFYINKFIINYRLMFIGWDVKWETDHF